MIRISNIITGGVFLFYYYRHMKDIYSVPYKRITPLTIKIVDFIMASLFSSYCASVPALIAYLISTPIECLIEYVRIINSGDVEEIQKLRERTDAAIKPLMNMDKEEFKRKCNEQALIWHRESEAIKRDINHDIEMQNRKGYPYRSKIT